MTTLADEFAELDDLLTDDDVPDDPEGLAGPGAAVQDRAHLNRIVRSIDRIRREAVQVCDLADAQLAKTKTWRDERLRILASEERHQMFRVASYHAMERAQDPRLVTIHLPDGDVPARAQQPEWEFDDAAFIPWAAENLPDALNIPTEPPPPTVNRNAAKKLLTQEREDPTTSKVVEVLGVTENDERPPGVKVTERDRKVVVTGITEAPKEYAKVLEAGA